MNRPDPWHKIVERDLEMAYESIDARRGQLRQVVAVVKCRIGCEADAGVFERGIEEELSQYLAIWCIADGIASNEVDFTQVLEVEVWEAGEDQLFHHHCREFERDPLVHQRVEDPSFLLIVRRHLAHSLRSHSVRYRCSRCGQSRGVQ